MANSFFNSVRFEEIFLRGLRPYIWIFLTELLLYNPALFFDYTYLDDNTLIIDNSHYLADIRNLFRAFGQGAWSFMHSTDNYYRPVLIATFILDAQFSGTGPFGFHLTNLLIHFLACCLLYYFLLSRDIRKEISFLLAVLFTVHPVLSSCVAWVGGRNDSLLTIFILLSFIFYSKYLHQKRILFFLLHLLSFLLGLLTKETAIVFPLLATFSFYAHAEKSQGEKIRKIFLIAGWISILLIWFVLRKNALGGSAAVPAETVFRSLLLNSPALLLCLGKVLLPFNLSVLPILPDSTLIFGWISLFAFLIILFRIRKIRYSHIFFGTAWFLFFLIPTFIRFNPETRFDFMVRDDRMYLPLVGAVLLFAEFLPGILQKRLHRFTPVAVIILFGTLASLYLPVFKNKRSFWKNAERNSPHLPMAHLQMGNVYYRDGELSLAAKSYQRTLELNPYEPMVHNNLGLIYATTGRYEEAEKEYKNELSVYPDYDKSYFNLGLLYYRTGRKQEAAANWEKAVSVNPDNIEALIRLVEYNQEIRSHELAIKYIEMLRSKKIPVPREILRAAELSP